ncbi:hypothetical protein SPRG_06066 [Saprolegnia parasitica CBS 223.65]|uniref:Sugar fermentation stimulation protein n=1 Tax=Saprolegnia parasitica (strain CBS 223.65) TaxID=695850 RepID=A0A067CR43_SAPPC|nr:hypothetical protein SPRG_06066 [Saprolegnia parasitica CBS 223.65]KDO29011.1 hypothetical protein SPRG_06066 [Saprolegnia parasitica CBS 223.65]|eukprot:XP_012200181.1 hypothetical protein SPRG_06066 [Saprolegnia parasitica CBS 223.65]
MLQRISLVTMAATRRRLRSSSSATKELLDDLVAAPKKPKRAPKVATANAMAKERTSGTRAKAAVAKPGKSLDIVALAADADARIVYTYPRLVQGKLLKRYKRFLADIQLANDEVVTVHCPNTGPMIGLLDLPLANVQLSVSDNPKRKYAHTLEQIQVHNGRGLEWVGVHSMSANAMVGNALRHGWLPDVVGHALITKITAEVKHTAHSRIDFVVETNGPKTFYIEVKSVTLRMDNGRAVFPDTVSTRAQKHVDELIALRASHGTSIQPTIVFLIQRRDSTSFAPSTVHDPAFAALCASAKAAGVHLFAYACELITSSDAGHIVLLPGPLPVHTDD